MAISKKYNDSIEKLQKTIKKLQDDTVLESLENKTDMDLLSYLGRLDIILRGFSGRLIKATKKPELFKNDQHVCAGCLPNVYANCVFDDSKIECDKKAHDGRDILSKETCPYWVKFEQINKPK